MSDISSLMSLATHMHAVALALAATGICWAALLTGLSRMHWFWRISALCLPLLLLLPIRAYEPLVLLFPLVIALACSAAALRTRWERELNLATRPTGKTQAASKRTANRWSLSLSDALLVMTVIGVMLALLVQLPWRNLNLSWSGLLFDGVLLYSLSLVCFCLIGLRGGMLWAAALFGCVMLGIVFQGSYGDGLRALDLMGMAGPEHMTWTPLGEFYLLFVTLLLIGLWLIRWCWLALDQPQVFAKRRRVVGSLAAVVASPVVVLYFAMFVGPSPVATPKIRNNSLPQLVEVAHELNEQLIGDLTREEVAQDEPQGNRAELVERLFQKSLAIAQQPGSVSLDASRQANEHSLAAQEDQLQVLRGLARRWLREADQALRHGDIRRAAAFDLATLRLGNYLARGGIRIHVQAATAIKSEGLSHLTLFRNRLPADLVPVVLRVLETLEAGAEDPLLTAARDRYWTDIAYGWRNRIEIAVQRALGLASSDSLAYQNLKTPLAREAVQRRLLCTEIAIKQYRDEHGIYPPTLAALVPTRLSLLPQDPFTEQGLVYRPLQFGFVLYSTGPDARDNGGRFARFSGEAINLTGLDWNLESLYRSGWRHPSRWRNPGINPQRGFGPGAGNWTSPPWDRTRQRSAGFVQTEA